MASFTKEQALTNLKGLISRYRDNLQDEEYRKNESRICDNLIIPFFKIVLNWEPEIEFKSQYREGQRKVDYLVFLDGVSQFVVEAKSLAHDIRKESQYYQQAIDYANYKERKFAVLTNFKYFIVLDAEIETEPLKAEVACIDIEDIKDSQFDILWAFSKSEWSEKRENNEVLLKLKGKKKEKIDELLLEDLKLWRPLLLNNLNKHSNKNKLDFEKDIHYIEEEVQKFIDRLIFICYCEDKPIMETELKSIIIDKESERYWDKTSYISERIKKLFHLYNDRYNSDLFAKSWCDDFYFDDSTLLQILKDLRQPKGKRPYDFSIIEADILGKTYENFIGHVLAVKKRIKEKESKGKRKEMGIYYTPTYIVNYIVRNTVGEYIKGKSIASINKVKILDPACGSGSFLIKAFDILVEECEKIRKLNYDEKKDLMLNCIHGVDKDERAVDICKLNLSLKLATQGKPLPELHNNIKCGDSLIDDKNIVGEDKAFNWNEKFKSIMDNGGFDVVIGNPPYLILKENNTSKQTIKYLQSAYYSADFKINAYALFIEIGITKLNDGGLFGFIIPDTLLNLTAFKNSRDLILRNCKIREVVYFNNSVFGDAAIGKSIIIIFEKKKENEKNRIIVSVVNDFREIQHKKTSVDQDEFKHNSNLIFNIFSNNKEINILDKIVNKTIKLSEICVICDGINPGSEYIKNKVLSKSKISAYCKKIIDGKEFYKYSIIMWGGQWINYDFNFVENLRKEVQRKGDSFTARIIKKDQFFEREKIVTRQTSDKLIGTLDRNKYYTKNSVHSTYLRDNLVGLYDLRFILTLINSKLLNFYYISVSQEKGRLYPQVKISRLENLPIKNIPPENQLSFINLADKMLSLNKKLQEIGDKNTIEKEKIQKEIQTTDNEIDELVYQLYGITEEEKKIIEESLK